eukprot:m.76653 g.76653  ORF g.76653 m.76653 type:complete len:399 (-) comp9083_c0_seq2:1680-2876(-)
MPRWATSPPIGLLWSFAVAAILGFATDPLTHLAHHWGSGRVASEVDVHREHRARGAEPDTHRHNHNHTHQQPVPQRLPQGAAGDAIVSTLPHYLIVGVPKAGTSVLYFGLCGVHPNITCASFVKEPFFLTGPEAQTLLSVTDNGSPTRIRDHAEAFARQYIETCFNLSMIGPNALVAEASTSYFHSHLAADVIGRLPNQGTKFIVAFREPVARAYSWYQHQRRRGSAPSTFRLAVDAEVRAVVGCSARLSAALRASKGDDLPDIAAITRCLDHARSTLQDPFGRKSKNYIFDSLYIGRLIEWRRRFGDRLHVVLYDDIRHNPRAAIDGVVAFLGLDPVTWDADTVRIVRHEFQQGSRYEELPADDPVAAALRELFEPYNRLLARHLNRPVPWARYATH